MPSPVLPDESGPGGEGGAGGDCLPGMSRPAAPPSGSAVGAEEQGWLAKRLPVGAAPEPEVRAGREGLVSLERNPAVSQINTVPRGTAGRSGHSSGRGSVFRESAGGMTS